MVEDHRGRPYRSAWWGAAVVKVPRDAQPPDEASRPRLVRVSKDLVGWVLPAAPPARRRRRGRPSGPAYVVDAAEFERRLIASIRLLEKDGTPVSQPQLACHLNISLGTFKNYLRRYAIDYRAFLRRIRASGI